MTDKTCGDCGHDEDEHNPEGCDSFGNPKQRWKCECHGFKPSPNHSPSTFSRVRNKPEEHVARGSRRVHSSGAPHNKECTKCKENWKEREKDDRYWSDKIQEKKEIIKGKNKEINSFILLVVIRKHTPHYNNI